MKLLWAFPSFEIGGAQRRFAALAGAMGADFEHIVIAHDGRYDAEVLLDPKARYRRHEIALAPSRLVSLGNLRAMRGALKAVAPDVLITCNWGCYEWLWAARGRAHIHCEDGFGPEESRGARLKKRDLARRLAFARAPGRAYIAPSSGLKRIFIEAWRAPQAAVHLIPNGVDIARFSVTPKAQGAPVIGSVGALRPEKRYDRLIRILAALHDRFEARLLLVGDGPERGALEALAHDLGVARRVEFAGAQSDVAPFLARMDLFALTSDTEQMPISLVEAMAAGLPAICTDVGDIARMLCADNRRFVRPPQDEKGLAEAAAALLEEAPLRHDLGAQNASCAAARYSLEAMAARWREVIQGARRSG